MAGGSPRSNAGSDDDPTENQINASESPRNHLRRRTRTRFEFGFQTSYRVFIIYTRQRLRPSATAGGQGGGETNQFSGTPRDSEHFKEGASQTRPSHGPTHAHRRPGIPGPGTTHRGPPRAGGVVPRGGTTWGCTRPRGGDRRHGRFLPSPAGKKKIVRESQRYPRPCGIQRKCWDVDGVSGRHG